jgi:general secretion pathway protein C
MRVNHALRTGSLPPRRRRRSLPVVVLLGGALAAAVVYWHQSPGDVTASGDGVVVVAGDAPAAVLPATNVGLELRSVFVGGSPAASSATIATGGQPAATWRIGQEVAPGITLASVHDDHVVLVENGVSTDLYLAGGARSVVAPARQGLDPEPTRPSGELSAEELIARTTAAGAEPVQKTPEEEAAGR